MKQLLKTGLLATAIATSFVSVSVVAQEAAVNEKHAKAATNYRQALYKLVYSNMAPLGGMAKGKIPFKQEVIATNALRLEQLADMMGDYLKTDTSGFDVETEAKDEIWQNWSDVEDKIAQLKAASANLASVASSGNESQYRAAIGKVGGACKACHDDYKAD